MSIEGVNVFVQIQFDVSSSQSTFTFICEAKIESRNFDANMIDTQHAFISIAAQWDGNYDKDIWIH